MLKISTNCYKAKKITNAEQIMKLANEGKSIYHSGWRRITPAAFLQNFQLRVIVNQIKNGYLYTVINTKK